MPQLLSALGPLLTSCGVLCLVTAACSLFAAVKGRALRSARFAYVSSVTGAVTFWGVFFRTPGYARPEFMNPGPLSDLRVTLLCVGAAWLLLGIVLFVLGRKPWTPDRAVYWLAFVVLAGLYTNVVREREHFGDFFDYVGAANQLIRGEPLHARYLYPPLLATLLAPLVKYGDSAIFLACIAANLISVLMLFDLLRRCLGRYGFSSIAAIVLSFAALAANVAMLRTLFYVQTNLHVTNLMLLSLLCYPQQRWASALSLALGAHIKTSPLALVLPFVLNRDWKWLAWFALFLFGFVGFTSYLNGFHRYGEWLDNVSNIYRANGLSLRESSLDSLVRVTLFFLHEPLELSHKPVLVMRVLLFVLSMWLCWAAIRRGTFSGMSVGAGTVAKSEARVLDSYPILLLFLTSVSPLVWEHHPVVFVLGMLVLLKPLDREGDAILWLLAWFLCFLVPTFDLYPWSFRIALGVGFAYWLLVRLVRRKAGPGRYFTQANAMLARLGVSPHSERSSAPPASSK